MDYELIPFFVRKGLEQECIMVLLFVLDIKDTYCYGPFKTCTLSHAAITLKCCFVHEAALRNLPGSFLEGCGCLHLPQEYLLHGKPSVFLLHGLPFLLGETDPV